VSDDVANSVGSVAPGHYGVGGTGVTLAEIAIGNALNVQGDPDSARFLAEVQQRFDITLPLAPNTTTCDAMWTALWLGPTSWLLVAEANSLPPSPHGEFSGQRDALNAVGGALFDVCASRVALAVGGIHAGSVLAESCPLDLHPRAFPAGRCAQSMLGRVNALLYKHGETSTFRLMVARSFARDVWRTLCVSAAQYGYDVLAPSAPRQR